MGMFVNAGEYENVDSGYDYCKSCGRRIDSDFLVDGVCPCCFSESDSSMFV